MVKLQKKSGRGAGIQSMTGFGRVQAQLSGAKYVVELRSVNNRGLDIVLRLPKEFSELEKDIRSLVAKNVIRGRVELTVQNNGTTGGALPSVSYLRRVPEIKALLKEYRAVFAACNVQFDAAKALFEILARRDGQLEPVQKIPSDKDKAALLKLIGKGLTELVAFRLREGVALINDISVRVSDLSRIKGALQKMARAGASTIAARLNSNLKALLSSEAFEANRLEQGRLEQEVALLAERADYSEELARLGSHLELLTDTLASAPKSKVNAEAGYGKRIEFILQELLREFNTVGSKAQDAAVATLVIRAKGEIEKIREQAMNLQ